MSTKPKQATKPYTTTNKILNILGIIILAVIPQPFIDAYFLVKAEWAKPVSKPAPKKKAKAKKAAGKKQAENKAPAKKRVRNKSKEQPVTAPTGPTQLP